MKITGAKIVNVKRIPSDVLSVYPKLYFEVLVTLDDSDIKNGPVSITGDGLKELFETGDDDTHEITIKNTYT